VIERAVTARDDAVAAAATSRGRGSYSLNVYDEASNLIREERATFRTARSDQGEFIQFRYEDGKGFESPDVYARVVLSDGTNLYESRFCSRILIHGAEGRRYPQVDPGSLQPLSMISGNLAAYYGFVHTLLDDDSAVLSLRDEDGCHVVSGAVGNGVILEFWIDPRLNHHIVRYRSLRHFDGIPIVLRDVRSTWKHAADEWYPERCDCREPTLEGSTVRQIEEYSLTYDTFEMGIDIPTALFAVDALGLPQGARILADEHDADTTYFMADPDFNWQAVVDTVGPVPHVRILVE
jgi:hypothetical protein